MPQPFGSKCKQSASTIRHMTMQPMSKANYVQSSAAYSSFTEDHILAKLMSRKPSELNDTSGFCAGKLGGGGTFACAIS